jgi:hypothetical protein
LSRFQGGAQQLIATIENLCRMDGVRQHITDAIVTEADFQITGVG